MIIHVCCSSLSETQDLILAGTFQRKLRSRSRTCDTQWSDVCTKSQLALANQIQDYYHKEYSQIVEGLFNKVSDFSLLAPASDNNLINGKMNFDCSQAPPRTKCTNNAGVSKFKFTAGKTHRLRLINAGAEGLQRFSIDGHILTVIANDFMPIVPYNTKVVTLGVSSSLCLYKASSDLCV